jgi:large subunit ribosomal protein L17
MYKGVKKAKLGRKASSRKALMINQIRSLFASGHIVTTSPKAKVLKANADSMIALGKKNRGMLSLRRKLVAILKDEKLVKKFIEYVEKAEAGVRIVKIGYRKGDNGEKSKVELIGMEKKTKKIVKKTAEKKEEMKAEEKPSIAKVAKKLVMKDSGRGIDKNVVVKKAERAKTRSGL